MTSHMQIFWTAANIEEARRVSKALVEKHLVACAHIEPGIESIFFWEGKVDTANEVKVVFKTKSGLISKVQEFIRSNCSYSVPEILGVAIDTGNPAYLAWVDEVTAGPISKT